MKKLFPALALLATVACSGAGDEAATSEPPPSDGERLVEEGDIVRLEGNTMFVLNRWRGLLVVDLNEPTHPAVTGSIPYRSDPLELYVRNGHVFAVLRSPVDEELCPTCQGNPAYQSLLLVVNVQNPAAPRLVAKVVLDGFVTDTRFVGSAFYAVSNRGSLVQSVDLSDPARPRAVDRLALEHGDYQTQVLVTDKIFYVATAQDRNSETFGECGDRYSGAACTMITAIDVSSPTGQLRLGARYALSGYLMNRWALDHHEGTLRLMVRPSRWRGSDRPATLRTFRASSAYELEALASLPLLTERPEQLTAVRFDGPRAFAVTFERIDPLFTIDLQDPARPKLMGHLETPGWLDFILPRGDRLIAVGRDRDHDSGPWKLHVSLYDVSNLAQPRLLARALFGNGFDQLADDPNELAKVVRVVDELGLVLVPFHALNNRNLSPAQGQLQLFQFTRDTIVLAGNVVHPGVILRALPLEGSKLVTISHESAEVLDVSQPARPKVVGQLQLARQIRDVVLTDSHNLVLWENPATGRATLSLLPPGTTDLPLATSSVDVGIADRLFVSGARIFAVSTRAYVPASATVVTLGPQPTLSVVATINVGHSAYFNGSGAGDRLGSTVMPLGENHLAFLGQADKSELVVVDETGVVGKLEWSGVEDPVFLGRHQGHLVVRARERRNPFGPPEAVPPYILAFIDASNPAAPRLLAQTRVAGLPFLAQDGLLISDVNRSFTISNIDAAGAVTGASTMPGISEFSVALDGALAAVRTPGSLRLLDLTMPTTPRELARIAQPRGGAVRALVRGRAFLEGAFVYDLRNGNPRLEAQLPSSLPLVDVRSRPTPTSTQAYFSGGFHGVHVLALD